MPLINKNKGRCDDKSSLAPMEMYNTKTDYVYSSQNDLRQMDLYNSSYTISLTYV
jgi:hypothetical protein